ncbi:MAG: hypothetical protein ACYDHY_15305 [Acidiferrobacterales bacterium]
MTDNLSPIIPVGSPDPDGTVERQVKAAWALGGMAVLTGILAYFIHRIGLTFLPAHPGPLDYARAGAFAIACANVLFWVWFPLEDLRVLRKWVRTEKAFFSANTAEFLGMALATIN